jgi:small subunit ribosomal protein S8
MMAKKEIVDIPASKQIKSILDILKRENYIDNFKLMEDKKQGMLRVYLKYIAGRPAIRNLQRVSRPGLRVYVKQKNLPSVLRDRGLAIVSTPKGITTNREARNLGLGGEIIGYIW